MAKQEHGKQKEKGLGLQFVGSPEKIISRIIADKEHAKWATDQVVNEGPAHKQLQNAMLFKQLTELVNTVEKRSGKKFTPQKGQAIISKGPEHEMELPMSIPTGSLKGINEVEEFIDKVSKGPEHEILVNAIVLQVLAWANKEIKALPLREDGESA